MTVVCLRSRKQGGNVARRAGTRMPQPGRSTLLIFVRPTHRKTETDAQRSLLRDKAACLALKIRFVARPTPTSATLNPPNSSCPLMISGQPFALLSQHPRRQTGPSHFHVTC